MNSVIIIVWYYPGKAMAPHCSTLAWKIPWVEEPGGLQSTGSLGVGHERLHFHLSLSCIGEENGNLLHCSCLENPRDDGAWWAVNYGVAQSRTRLKRLSSSSSSSRWSCDTAPANEMGAELMGHSGKFCGPLISDPERYPKAPG